METISVEQLAENMGKEFFRCRSDGLEGISQYHVEALICYFETFAECLLLPDPDGMVEVDIESFVRERLEPV